MTDTTKFKAVSMGFYKDLRFECQIKRSLLLEIQWKQDHNLSTNTVYNTNMVRRKA
jgi:hypothetical protein